MKFTGMVIAAMTTAVFSMPALAADAGAPDEAAAMTLLRANKCLTCHSVDKKKDGPAYVAVAEKYRGKPDAIAKLTEWVSVQHTVTIDDEEEQHGLIKTDDPAKINNVVRWILSH